MKTQGEIEAALSAGISRFEASFGGLGGCPFAPGAAGNVATEDMVHMLAEMGVDTGVDLPALLDAVREAEKTLKIVGSQLREGLKNVPDHDAAHLVIAYEPVWAIGTGRTATQEQAQEVHAYVRRWFLQTFGEIFAYRLRILYGGSVKPANIKNLMAMPDVDGALVGGASLDPDSFSRLVHYQS